jgi:hypothetical protein
MPINPPVAAAKAVISRLLQMRRLWDDAAASYFDPDRFQLEHFPIIRGHILRQRSNFGIRSV